MTNILHQYAITNQSLKKIIILEIQRENRCFGHTDQLSPRTLTPSYTPGTIFPNPINLQGFVVWEKSRENASDHGENVRTAHMVRTEPRSLEL